MLFYGNIVIKRDSSVALFNPISYRREDVSRIYPLIKKINDKSKSGDSLDAEEQELLQYLKRKKQILPQDQIEKIDSYLYESKAYPNSISLATSGISIDVTYQCNLLCEYCFQEKLRAQLGKYKMTFEHIDRISSFIDWYSSNIEEISLPLKYVCISGGEPLLPDVQPIVHYIFSKFPESRFTLCTNGLYLTEFIESLKISLDHFEMIQISIDGILSDHLQRSDLGNWVDGTDRYLKMIEAVYFLVCHDVPVRIATVVDKKTYKKVPQLIHFLEEKGILGRPNVTIAINPVFKQNEPLSIDWSFNTPNDILDMSRYFRKTIPNYANSFLPFKDIKTLSVLFKRPLDKYVPPEVRNCSLDGHTALTFTLDGNVHFCECQTPYKGVVGEYLTEFRFSKDIVRNIKSDSFFSYEKCRKCIYRYLCKGGCWRHRNVKSDERISPYCGIYGDEFVMDNIGEFI